MNQIAKIIQPQPELALRQNLAAAYRAFAHFGMDDLTYTHLSARTNQADHYYIYPFGFLFNEVQASSLLKVSLDGAILEGKEYQYNQTGYNIHGEIYKARPDINAIFHLHTPAGIAVSALKEGLLPISQFSFHFYNRHTYHNYDSLALQPHQGKRLVEDMGPHKVIFLRNHGTLCAGTTIHEAFFYSYYLEQACRTQTQILAMGKEILIPPPQVIEKAASDMRSFEKDLGARDWAAILRLLEKADPTYKD